MAEEAEGAEVVEVALAAAFGYGADVVSVPEAATGGDGFHAVETQACRSGWASGSFECVVGGYGVDVADGADASVAGEDLIAKITGVGAETPLVDAVVAAEGAAAFGEDLEIAPAAEREIIGASQKGCASGVASWESAGDDHAGMRIRCGVAVWGDEMGSHGRTGVLEALISGVRDFRGL